MIEKIFNIEKILLNFNQDVFTCNTIHNFYGAELGKSFYCDGSHWHEPVQGLIYRINNIGMQGEDFDFDIKPLILTMGCSVTAGCGLRHEWTWPYLLQDYFGQKIVNLSFPGRPLSTIVENLLLYIQKYQVPEKLYILSPDIFRLYYSSMKIDVGNEFVYDHKIISWDESSGEYIYYDHDLNKIQEYKYYDAYNIQRSVSIDTGISDYIRSASILKRLVDIFEIDLKISSWDPLTAYLLSGIFKEQFVVNEYCENEISYIKNIKIKNVDKKNFNKLLYNENKYRDTLKRKKCHNNFNNKYWHTAADCIHPGIHSHIHYAEGFTGSKIQNSDILKLLETNTMDITHVYKKKNF